MPYYCELTKKSNQTCERKIDQHKSVIKSIELTRILKNMSLLFLSSTKKDAFFQEYGPVFDRNARWSTKRAVPKLGTFEAIRDVLPSG